MTLNSCVLSEMRLTDPKNGFVCSLSPNDKEIEAEFQRLSLGFKCDMFTLEKRLKLEQRSRDLAEENIRKEVSSCQGLLQALTPLCEDETQSMEIIQRLQKNLDILIQSTNRVSSRSEMLGAIHQENRIGKAVEVMIQHVENLKRTYTKEHAELLELRQALSQAERSFGGEVEVCSVNPSALLRVRLALEQNLLVGLAAVFSVSMATPLLLASLPSENPQCHFLC
uniref:Lymphoid-restricted membrane protein n=1 Tax=Oryzias sinensis TaxID=183150 RepID=A0A8C7ZZB5_9TELE